MRRLFSFAILLTILSWSVLNAAASAKPGSDGSSASAQTDAEGGRISVTAKASTVTPYQNQAVLYTVRVVVRAGISKLSVSDIDIVNGIVEETGSADISDGFEHGRPVKVAEFHFIITPLQPGKMTIPAVVLEGEFQTQSLAALADPLGNSAVSGATQQALNYFSTYGGKPFNTASNVTVLDVKPPVAAIDPWLPLTSLAISEKIDAPGRIHVGELARRTITLSATGGVGSQLPDIGVQQQSGKFSAYADKPTTGFRFDSKTAVISGWRSESYSIVARNAGPLLLPAIRVSWWDVVNDKAAIAELPERVLHIVPAKTAQDPPVNGSHSQNQQPAKKSEQGTADWQQNAIAYIGPALLFVGGGAVIATLLFGAFRLTNQQDKIYRPKYPVLTAGTVKQKSPNMASKASSAGRLKNVKTAEELRNFLQAYAYRHWGKSKSASLEQIFAVSPVSQSKFEEDVKALTRKLGAALYGGQAADVEDLKKCSRRIIKALEARAKSARQNRQELTDLNPS